MEHKLDFINVDAKITSNVTRFFKVLGDNTRMRILTLLFAKSCHVNEIAASLGMEQSAVSHQLKVLKKTRLVKSKRVGRYQIYALDDEHVITIIKMAHAHIIEVEHEQ